MRTDTGRIITLHLKGKTEGNQSFTVTLAGPGVRATNNWTVPRLVLREAQKQRGQLLVAPEQGLRLQVAQRDGVTQLDPAQAGVRQKGVLAFRLLQTDWQVALDLERVEAWIQLTSLQDVTVGEAQLRVFANLQYEIENTGVKGFRLRLPANAENVRFRGEQVADFIATDAPAAADARDWDVKLHRRMLGRYLLQLNYTVPVPAAATELTVRGIQALDVNLQRGFFTVQAGGRLQVRSDAPPPALQPTEWQVIPRALQQDLPAAAADYTFRLVEPDVRLPPPPRTLRGRPPPPRPRHPRPSQIRHRRRRRHAHPRPTRTPARHEAPPPPPPPPRTPASGSPSSTNPASGPGTTKRRC
ncbi:MAG: hypothetical protein M5U12_24880 [Verrucomicrobia bacterium]|nr:hypothetical protein [Verrucomicrobiota bacterium]